MTIDDYVSYLSDSSELLAGERFGQREQLVESKIHGKTLSMTSDVPQKPDLPPFRHVNSSEKWAACLDILQRQDRLAIDLEANSMYAYRERVCLIQISTAEIDFIVDPLPIEDLSGLGALIQDPGVEKIFHSAEYDLKLLKREFDWHIVNLFDTMWAARILGIPRVGLASLLGDLFQVRLDKRYQRADWCHRPLSLPQLSYAQADTHYLMALRDMLASQLEENGYMGEALEIFVEQSQVTVSPNQFDSDSFWSINGVKKLDAAGKAVLKALNIYRNEVASAQDRPLFKVLSNKTLLELAARRPLQLRDLQTIHGMTPGQVRRYGKQLLQIVRQNENGRPPKRPKRPPRMPDAVLNRYDRLHNWRKERGLLRQVESDVILNRNALWALAKSNPQTLAELETSGILGSIRLEAYGEELIRVLSEDK